jgi:hypothetical protein
MTGLSNTNSLRRDLEVLGLQVRNDAPIDLRTNIAEQDKKAG